MKRFAAMFIATVSGVVLSGPDHSFACAVCGVDPEPGFLWSMGFLISMPFAIATVAGSYFVYNNRRAKRAPENEDMFSE